MSWLAFVGWMGAGALFALWYAAHRRAQSLVEALGEANTTNKTAIGALTLANETNRVLHQNVERLSFFNRSLSVQAACLAAGSRRRVHA